MTHPKVQHYVPQFLLRGFTRGKHKRLYVFDKHTDRRFTAAPRNVAAESRFYDVETAAGLLTLEPSLGDLEHRTASSLERIRSSRHISNLSDDEKMVIAVFIAVQYLRTQQFREQIADLDRQVTDQLRKRGIDPSEVTNYRPFRKPNDVKAFALHMIVETSLELASLILSKDWMLVETEPAVPFIIGDSPVTLHNEQTFGFYGNIGFAVPGIEIYMPISERVSLYLTCKSNGDAFRESKRKLAEIRAVEGDTEEVRRLTDRIRPMLEALESGNVLPMTKENVWHHNSQQIVYAERWLFSPDGDFTLAERIIRDHPEVRRGRRGTVS